MTGTFPGRIVLAEGDEVDIDLQMGAGKIRLATPFAEIGAWDADTVEINARADAGFDLAVDDDVVTFYPNDPGAFGEVVGPGGASPDEPDEPEPIVFPGAGAGAPAVDQTEEPEPAASTEPAVAPEPAANEGSIEDLDAALEALRAESDEPPEASPEETPEPDEITAESFPSSSGRLARARERMRATEDAAEREPEAFDADEPEAPTDVPDETHRPVSSGFSIPGDPGYVDPLAVSPDADEIEDLEATDDEDDETLADEIVGQRSETLRLTTTVKRSIPFDARKVGIGVGVLALIAAVIFAAPVVMEILAGDDEATATTVTETTLAQTSTTVAPTTTTSAPTTTAAPVASDAFDISSQQFVERWNDVASDVAPPLRFRALLPSGDFEAGFTQYIAMLGTVGPDGTLDSFTIEVDPAGPSESDQLGIQALGVAIAVVDPTLEPAERAQLLGVLGLDVRDPDLAGLDGSVTRNGVAYSLQFDAEAVLLLLSVQPAG